MATNTKKAKSKELSEKKSAKRSEDVTPNEEKRNDAVKSVTDCESAVEEEKCESVVPQEDTPVEEVPPSPEPVYLEPVLPQLIIERWIYHELDVTQATYSRMLLYLSLLLNS